MVLKHKVTLGTVSHATMRPEDLIPAFVAELEYYGASIPNGLSVEATMPVDEESSYWTMDEVHYDLEALFDALNEIAPPYCYFGAHEGDGSDYGFWVSIESIDDARDSACKHGDYEFLDDGNIIQVNDHGNITLMDASFNEIWAVV